MRSSGSSRPLSKQAGRLDILVNNAGGRTGRAARLGASSDFADVLQLNVTAAYLCAQRALPLFRGGGKIVNIGSIYGSVAADDRIYEGSELVRASAPYLASKAALVQVTRDLAVRLAAQNIQVNCVSPGGIESGPARGVPAAICGAGSRRADGYAPTTSSVPWSISPRPRPTTRRARTSSSTAASAPGDARLPERESALADDALSHSPDRSGP